MARVVSVLMLALALAACTAPRSDAEADKAAIRQVIANMEAAWNRGDFPGYMQGFKNPDVVFVSRGRSSAIGRARSTIMSAIMAARRSGAGICISGTSGSRYCRPTPRS